MARYIENYCDEQMPPPYTFKGVRIWSFPMCASYNKVWALVKKYLRPEDSKNSDLSYDLLRSYISPISSLVYMMVLDYNRMACTKPPESRMGYFQQRECLFGIPLIVNFDGQRKIAFFCPFIFVDCGWSMVCGNTVLGYPKQPASFQLPSPRLGNQDYPIHIKAPVMVKCDPQTPQRWMSVAEIRMDLLEQGISDVVDNAENLREEIAEDVVGEGAFAWPFGPVERLFGAHGPFPLKEDLRDLFHAQAQAKKPSYEILQLKQIRNAQFPEQACYRSLLTCKSVLCRWSDFRLLLVPGVRLPSYASLDIVGNLGLFTEITGVIRPLMPYTMTCDFDFVDPIEQPI